MNLPETPGVSTEGGECIHCGLCLEVCPTYRLTGREEESARGRLLLARGLREGRWTPEPDVLVPLDHCLGCLACEAVCPSGVPYGRVLADLRAETRAARGAPRSRLERFLVRHLLWRNTLLGAVIWLYRSAHLDRGLRRLARAGWVPSTGRQRARGAPLVETPDRRRPLRSVEGAPEVVLLRGCATRHLFPATEAAMVRLLTRGGYHVVRADEPACCGALAHHVGERELAERFAREMATRWGEGDPLLISTAAGCGAHLKRLDHATLDPALRRLASRVAGRARDLSEALVQAPVPLVFSQEPVGTVAYQDACHLRHAQGLSEGPRALLRAAGATLVEPADGDLCCGSAGTYNIALPEAAGELGRRKVAALLATGAATVITSNPGCWIQLQAFWPDAGPRLVSLARFLDERLAP